MCNTEIFFMEELEAIKKNKTDFWRILFLIRKKRISIKYGIHVLKSRIEIYLFFDEDRTTEKEIYLTKDFGLKLVSEGVFRTWDGYLIELHKGKVQVKTNLKKIGNG